MAEIELRDYPVPDGIAVPNLMPYQLRAWNGDHFLAAEVLRLKEAHGLENAFETGTCLGSTTLWLWENFHHTRTVELHRPYFDIAVARIVAFVGRHIAGDVGSSQVWIGGHGKEGDPNSGQLCFGSSPKIIASFANNLKWSEEQGKPTFFFLDAHWTDNCPLLDELDEIARSGKRGCVLIHDFQVPGTDFGFDSMPDGRPFNLELIAPHLERIYGEGGYKVNYPTQVAGAKRGWVSIEPC